MPFPSYSLQAECLNEAEVLGGKNLVYCAPTSGGKSLVAEVIMLRRLLTTGRPALLVLPYISLCNQKAAHLQKLLEPMGRVVKSLYGSLGGAVIAHDTGELVYVMWWQNKGQQTHKNLMEGLQWSCTSII